MNNLISHVSDTCFFFDVSSDCMLLLDQEGNILRINRAGQDLLASTERELLGQSMRRLLHPEDREVWQSWLVRATSEGNQSPPLTARLTLPRPRWRTLEWYAEVDATQNQVYLMGRLKETLSFAEQHHALLENRHRLALVIKGGDVGLWDWDIETNQVTCNDRWYTMLGYAPDEHEITGEWWQSLLHPDDRATTCEKIKQWLANQLPFYFNIYRLKAHGGNQYRWIQTRGEVVSHDAQGNPTRAVGTHLDITEQKEGELSLRESDARLRELLRNFPNGSINVFDREYRYLFADGEGLSKAGLTPEALVGHTLRELFPPHQAEYTIQYYECVFRDGKPTQFELSLGPNVFHITAAPLRYSAQQEVETIVAVARDVTTQKQQELALKELNESLESKVKQRTRDLEQANQRLRKANEELESFSYSVSHDLRAPLRAITGFGSILMDEHRESLDGPARELLDIIVANSTRMGELIDNILAYSRLSRRERHPEVIYMTELFQEVFDELTAPLAQARVQFSLSPLRPAIGDPTMIRQAVMNILSNALKYSRLEPSPHIIVREVELPGGFAYMVQDNGVGFEQKYAEKIFRVFQRLHKSSEFEGTGVGMAIARRVLQQHGGSIWAEGQKGRGATFYFTLPHPE